MAKKVLVVATSADKLGSSDQPTGCWCGGKFACLEHFCSAVCSLCHDIAQACLSWLVFTSFEFNSMCYWFCSALQSWSLVRFQTQAMWGNAQVMVQQGA